MVRNDFKSYGKGTTINDLGEGGGGNREKKFGGPSPEIKERHCCHISPIREVIHLCFIIVSTRIAVHLSVCHPSEAWKTHGCLLTFSRTVEPVTIKSGGICRTSLVHHTLQVQPAGNKCRYIRRRRGSQVSHLYELRPGLQGLVIVILEIGIGASRKLRYVGGFQNLGYFGVFPIGNCPLPRSVMIWGGGSPQKLKYRGGAPKTFADTALFFKWNNPTKTSSCLQNYGLWTRYCLWQTTNYFVCVFFLEYGHYSHHQLLWQRLCLNPCWYRWIGWQNQIVMWVQGVFLINLHIIFIPPPSNYHLI